MKGLLLWFACACLTGAVAKYKNYGFGTGFGSALFLGPLALMAAIIAPKEIPKKEQGIIERWLNKYNAAKKYKPEVGEAVATILNAYANASMKKAKLGCLHLNTSHLPYPKKTIEYAFIISIMTSTDEEVTEQLMTNALSLADWQPTASEDPLILYEVRAALESSGTLTDELMNKLEEMVSLTAISNEEAKSFFEQLKEVRANARQRR